MRPYIKYMDKNIWGLPKRRIKRRIDQIFRIARNSNNRQVFKNALERFKKNRQNRRLWERNDDDYEDGIDFNELQESKELPDYSKFKIERKNKIKTLVNEMISENFKRISENPWPRKLNTDKRDNWYEYFLTKTEDNLDKFFSVTYPLRPWYDYYDTFIKRNKERANTKTTTNLIMNNPVGLSNIKVNGWYDYYDGKMENDLYKKTTDTTLNNIDYSNAIAYTSELNIETINPWFEYFERAANVEKNTEQSTVTTEELFTEEFNKAYDEMDRILRGAEYSNEEFKNFDPEGVILLEKLYDIVSKISNEASYNPKMANNPDIRMITSTDFLINTIRRLIRSLSSM